MTGINISGGCLDDGLLTGNGTRGGAHCITLRAEFCTSLKVITETLPDNPAFCQYDWGIGFWWGEHGPGLSSQVAAPIIEYLGCSHALAKGGAAQSQALRQSKLSTGIGPMNCCPSQPALGPPPTSTVVFLVDCLSSMFVPMPHSLSRTSMSTSRSGTSFTV